MSHRGKKASLYHSERPGMHDLLRVEGRDSDAPPPSFHGTRPNYPVETSAPLLANCGAEDALPLTLPEKHVRPQDLN